MTFLGLGISLYGIFFSNSLSISSKIHCLWATICTFVIFTPVGGGCFKNTSLGPPWTILKTHLSDVIIWLISLTRGESQVDLSSLHLRTKPQMILAQATSLVFKRNLGIQLLPSPQDNICIPGCGKLPLLCNRCCCSFCSEVPADSSLPFSHRTRGWTISLLWTSQVLCFFSISQTFLLECRMSKHFSQKV